MTRGMLDSNLSWTLTGDENEPRASTEELIVGDLVKQVADSVPYFISDLSDL